MITAIGRTVEAITAVTLISLLVVRELLRAQGDPPSLGRMRRLLPLTIVAAVGFVIVIARRFLELAG